MKLARIERRLVARLFDGILPPGGRRRLPLAASEAGVVGFFEQHLGFMPRRARWGLRAAVDLAGVYARVHPGGAEAALTSLASSRIYLLREVLTLLKSVVCMGYFVDARVRDELGLDLTLGETK